MNISIDKINNLANTTKVTTPTGTYYFSYQTCVAFRDRKGNLSVIENYWSTTTGKHLNAIDGGTKEAKAKRLDRDSFNMVIEGRD